MSYRALDLFCGAGGASMGLHLAGFEVTGVDIRPQPRYPFAFIQADALTVDLDGYDLIWASPPCQAFTALRTMPNSKHHPNLIPPVREALTRSAALYIIENVPGAPLMSPLMLYGTMFGLACGPYELRRHRLFETNFALGLTPPCAHGQRPLTIGVYGGAGGRSNRDGHKRGASWQRREAMQIPWMTRDELSQAVPPAYARFIGEQAIRALGAGKETAA